MTATGYDDRIFLVEATGLRQSDQLSSHYTVKVPYRSLARTLQFINQSGGKIVRVSSLTLSLPHEQPLQRSIYPAVVEESLHASNYGALQGSTPTEVIKEGRPGSSADPEKALSSDVKIDGELTPSAGVSETEAVPVPLPAPLEVSAPSPKLPGLLRSWLEKLTSLGSGT